MRWFGNSEETPERKKSGLGSSAVQGIVMLATSVALRCFVRCGCINAAISARAMQEIGVLFALEPAVMALYPPGKERREALLRHVGHSNTHPSMMPLYLGITLSLEARIADGSLPAAALSGLSRTLSTTLSAIGDGFFEGAVLPCWSLACVIVVLCGHVWAAVALTALLVAGMAVFRICLFFYGLRHGVAALQWLKRLALIDWAGRIKRVNAVMLALLPGVSPWAAHSFPWLLCMPALLCAVAAMAFAGRVRFPRILFWLMGVSCLAFLDTALVRG